MKWQSVVVRKTTLLHTFKYMPMKFTFMPKCHYLVYNIIAQILQGIISLCILKQNVVFILTTL